MAIAKAERLCRIKVTLGEPEACPEGACPFWEEGGALIEADCGLERLHLDFDRPALASYLVELRTGLERARSIEERRAVRLAFSELVPPELSGT